MYLTPSYTHTFILLYVILYVYTCTNVHSHTLAFSPSSFQLFIVAYTAENCWLIQFTTFEKLGGAWGQCYTRLLCIVLCFYHASHTLTQWHAHITAKQVSSWLAHWFHLRGVLQRPCHLVLRRICSFSIFMKIIYYPVIPSESSES